MHTFQTPTVRELPRRPIDVVSPLLGLDDWRERAEQIAEMDATRRIIVSAPNK